VVGQEGSRIECPHNLITMHMQAASVLEELRSQADLSEAVGS
jgi:hypothetical protein